MARELFVKRQGNAFLPADPLSERLLQEYGEGVTVKARVTMYRNSKHHRKFFALMKVCFDHQDTYPTLETFVSAVKCAVGYSDRLELVTGGFMYIPKSIAFDKMDQQEFNDFYKRVVYLVTSRIIPQANKADLEREINELLDGQAA